MDHTRLDKLCEYYYKLLDFENLSFEDSVSSYDSVLRSLFSDNIFNRGRYYVADYFAVFIAKRHANKYLLLRALRERLEEKWHGERMDHR
jgi:hypothetical protein